LFYAFQIDCGRDATLGFRSRNLSSGAVEPFNQAVLDVVDHRSISEKRVAAALSHYWTNGNEERWFVAGGAGRRIECVGSGRAGNMAVGIGGAAPSALAKVFAGVALVAAGALASAKSRGRSRSSAFNRIFRRGTTAQRHCHASKRDRRSSCLRRSSVLGPGRTGWSSRTHQDVLAALSEPVRTASPDGATVRI
jgi:hypothetical protein